MTQVTDKEREILAEWVPGVDLSKVKIQSGPRIDKVCSLLGAQAVTIGYRIFASSKSWIMRYPPGHPVRMALLAHELFHVKQEVEKWLPRYMAQYLAIGTYLVLKVMITKRWFTSSKLVHFVSQNHPYEKPAYKLQSEFLEKYWTEKEAEKWKGVTAK